MQTRALKFAVAGLAGLGIALGATGEAVAQKKGGTLNFVVGSKIPSFDAHIETTFGMIHPIAPFYSLLIRLDPDDPDSGKLVCDVCEGDVPEATNDGKTYTFKIRKDVKFADGTPLTAHDIVATYNKIINPPEGIASSRKASYRMVESFEATDDHTVVFNLKFPSGAFMPAMASPFNFIYSKKDLETHGLTWHQQNVNGSGPFRFVEYQPGSHVSGERNPDYHHEGRPFLDGFRAISAPKMSVRVQAIRGDRAAIEFRGFPPSARDELVKALGDQITVQSSDWNCVLIVTPNHAKKPFDDVRVRKALSLALDRWGGSKYLSRIAIVRTVGGVVFPKHPLAATKEELEKIPGYWPDIEKSREEARRLLKEAGAENISFTLNNRAVDQPYKVVGTWLIDQWKRIGLNVTQQVNPTPVFYDILRKQKSFDVSIDFNCQTIINPIADVTKFLPTAGSNYASFEDAKTEEIYAKLERAPTIEEQRPLMREFENRVLSENVSQMITLWWYKINPHRSYVKGWKVTPSHYLGQQLDQVWLDK
ncbi:MAG: ABC transporter substrate-binding protein [Cyanobacteria bacterium P01_C01_bin.120]